MTSPPLRTHTANHHPPSHYEILQISPTATDEEIKQAYRSLVVRIHPDKNVTTPYHDEATCRRGGKVEHACSLADIDDDDPIHIQGHDGDVENLSTENEGHCSLELETNEQWSASEEEHLKSPLCTDSVPRQQQQQQQSNDNSTKFHQIQSAYNTLRDSKKRAAYDESLKRQKEREVWVNNAATEVNLSEMESDLCCIVDSENNDSDAESEGMLQTVYFYHCRCGDIFEIVREELMEELRRGRAIWHCESCSLAIRVCVDIDIT
ncbi:hypothetical protein HJC23_009115 [Cyclotella cryptica]|uniref:Diphthamide biosynthesis protein 3 n=1 Tax=Cyclotella cryptica TaxID=29204 RepID=A0ABD3QZ08_9STRA|eukprot:CCRYP_000761-RA/>CCRYP_000761-RA protein AED:0.00 eAED:0.00 QI:106/-1/1/1/-1/1/1/330/263